MLRRYKNFVSANLTYVKLQPFTALRQKFKEGYSRADLRADILAGLVVGTVAIPLGMALAIASGVSPQAGLYTVIIGGFFTALLGGSRCQVTGPTAAFVVILVPIAMKFGFAGLLIAGFMAGLMLIMMGMAGFGSFLQFIPHPVVTGFTSGIALVIATIQVKDLLGLHVDNMPQEYLDRVVALFRSLPTFSFSEFLVSAATFAILIWWPKYQKRIPAPLVALSAVGLVSFAVKYFFPSVQIATIGERFQFTYHGMTFHGIPQSLPEFNFPWNFADANGKSLSFGVDTFKQLFSSAFAIAMLGAIESLLSATVADGMAQTKHDPNAELVALGVSNILCPFFGGIAATGAIARTATNIRYGARSPIAAMTHAVFTLLVVLLFAPYVSYLPMAALAALLVLVAYNMSEVKHFAHIVKVAPKSDVLVLLICFTLTVVFDMVIGVSVGVVLAALMFMRRMSVVTSVQSSRKVEGRDDKRTLPEGYVIYEIAGPLFFGAAERAMEALSAIASDVKAVVFDMHLVPVMDVTALVAFESAVAKLKASKRQVILVGLRTQPFELFQKTGMIGEMSDVLTFPTIDDVLVRTA